MPFVKWRKFMAGKGKGRAGFVGLQKQSITLTGNVGANEDNLISLTLEKNTLYKAGQTIRITAWGNCAGNGNNKTLKLYFGTTAILTTGAVAANAKKWIIEAIVVRRTAGAQRAVAWGTFNDTEIVPQTNTAVAEDETTDLTIKCTGEATDNDDIQQEGMLVEVLTQ